MAKRATANPKGNARTAKALDIREVNAGITDGPPPANMNITATLAYIEEHPHRLPEVLEAERLRPNPRKRIMALDDGEPVPPVPSRIPEPPAYLAHETARSLWSAIWTAGAHHYDPTFDRQLIERYVEIIDEMDELRTALDNSDNKKKGAARRKYLSTGSTGQLVIDPRRKDLKELRKELLPIEKELGKTPEARARLGMAMEQHRSRLGTDRDDLEPEHIEV